MTPVVEAKCQLTGSIVILAPLRHTELELAQGRRAASFGKSQSSSQSGSCLLNGHNEWLVVVARGPS